MNYPKRQYAAQAHTLNHSLAIALWQTQKSRVILPNGEIES